MSPPRRPPMRLYCDGSCLPRNPGGYACWGWVALNTAGQAIQEAWGCVGRGAGMTNNRAEYAAVLQGLRWAAREGHRVLVFTDAQLIVRQVTGTPRTLSPALRPLCEEVRALLASTGSALVWISRAQNDRADELSRRAYFSLIRAAALKGDGAHGETAKEPPVGRSQDAPQETAPHAPEHPSVTPWPGAGLRASHARG